MLMHIAVEKSAKEGLSFFEYVNFLSNEGYVPPNGKHWVDHIRKKGNDTESDGEYGVPAGHTNEEIADHVQQLIAEGLVEGVVVRDREGVPSGAAIIRLTSKGHDFVDATRNPSFWLKTKGYVTKNLPGWTLSILREVAERAIKGEIKF
jgi:hypothetical protein